jgi:hypothetical protein
LLHPKIGGLFALQDSIAITCRQAKQVGDLDAIGCERAVVGKRLDASVYRPLTECR